MVGDGYALPQEALAFTFRAISRKRENGEIVKDHFASVEQALARALTVLWESVPGMQLVSMTPNPALFERAFDICAVAKLPRTGDEVELWVEWRELPRRSLRRAVGRGGARRVPGGHGDGEIFFPSLYLSSRGADGFRPVGIKRKIKRRERKT